MASISIGELEVVPYRTRATRSTNGFSRTVGTPFVLGFRYREVMAEGFRIPVMWGADPVEFTLRPVQRHNPRYSSQPRNRSRRLNSSSQQEQQAGQRTNK